MPMYIRRRRQLQEEAAREVREVSDQLARGVRQAVEASPSLRLETLTTIVRRLSRSDAREIAWIALEHSERRRNPEVDEPEPPVTTSLPVKVTRTDRGHYRTYFVRRRMDAEADR
jgi:CRP-like cAMP-binding protein